MSDIEVVTVRYPDSGTEVRVFVNGVDVTDEASVFHVDPGAGYTLSDWRETTEHDVKAASCAAGEFIREQRDGCENSQYLIADDESESCPEPVAAIVLPFAEGGGPSRVMCRQHATEALQRGGVSLRVPNPAERLRNCGDAL